MSLQIDTLNAQILATLSRSVTLDWVQSLPHKMQSVLFSGLRGPDTGHYPNLKAVVRWLRPVTQHNADPTTDYMRNEEMPDWKALQKEIEFTSFHYFEHLALALEIIAYKHPDELKRNYAWFLYASMIELLHANPETEEQLDARLTPKPVGVLSE
jgi:hypothetical protein